MKRKFVLRYAIATTLLILVSWVILTIYVEQTGPAKQWMFGKSYGKKTLIVFDPDPFYNLDEQVCVAFGKAIASDSMAVTIATVAAAKHLEPNAYDVLVYCANTYNWRPDWSIKHYIEKRPLAASALVVAITLGTGSTESSRKHFETTITTSGGKLIESYSLWLWRPNDETKTGRNVDVAVTLANKWGKQISHKLN